MRPFLALTARPQLEIYRDLERAAAARGLVVTTLDALRLVAQERPPWVWDGSVPLRGETFGAVLPRVGNYRPDSVLAVLASLVAAGVPTINPPEAIRRGRDHWRTVRALAAAGLPHPATVAGAEPESVAAAAAAAFGFPCVVKQRQSRQGVGVIRCASLAELEAVLDSLWRLGEEVVVQRFCPPGGVSRRILVVDGDALAAVEHRAAAGEFRSNAARGGELRAVTPTGEERDLAVAAAAILGLSFAGVDLLPDDGRWVVGEVNPSPGWRHLQAATGVAVPDRLLDALVRRGSGGV